VVLGLGGWDWCSERECRGCWVLIIGIGVRSSEFRVRGSERVGDLAEE